MTGLEKMVNQILEEARTSANGKVEGAKAKAETIMNEAREEASKLVAEIAAQSATDVANHKERVKSSADLRRRTALLAAKQEMISDIIEKAYAKFCSKDDAAYFETIKEMVEKFAQPQEGEIYFSQVDLEKLPSGLEAEIAKIAEAKGGKLTLAKESRNIEKGFVLSYGGIEENCSFKSLFASKKDELQDKVQKILFA